MNRGWEMEKKKEKEKKQREVMKTKNCQSSPKLPKYITDCVALKYYPKGIIRFWRSSDCDEERLHKILSQNTTTRVTTIL